MDKILIIGAGFAGFGAAHFLSINGIDATVVEKEEAMPEHKNSITPNKFTFDKKLHVISTQNEWFAKMLHNFGEHENAAEQLNIRYFFKGNSIKHPPIENLYGLPKSLVIKIILELSELKTENEKFATNLKEWLYATFGQIYTDTLLEKLIQKKYTLSSEKIDFSEMKNNFERPSFEDILLGALTDKTNKSGEEIKNHYLLNEGNLAFPKRNNADIQVKYGYKVEFVDPYKKIVFFENGEKESYNYLISSMPLPDLISSVKKVPEKIQIASEKLAFTNCVTVKIGIDRKLSSKLHYAFFYDRDILFSKIVFPNALQEKNTLGNYSNFQASIHFSKKYKPLQLEPKSFIEPVIHNMKRCSILQENDRIIYKRADLMPYANIIHDFNRRPNLKAVHNYLDDANIFYCGRYGMWNNLSADESVESGVNAARKVKDILTLKTGGRIAPDFFNFSVI